MPRRKLHDSLPSETPFSAPAAVVAEPKDVPEFFVTAVFEGEVKYTFTFVDQKKSLIRCQSILHEGVTVADEKGVITIYPPHRLLRIEMRNAL